MKQMIISCLMVCVLNLYYKNILTGWNLDSTGVDPGVHCLTILTAHVREKQHIYLERDDVTRYLLKNTIRQDTQRKNMNYLLVY